MEAEVRALADAIFEASEGRYLQEGERVYQRVRVDKRLTAFRVLPSWVLLREH